MIYLFNELNLINENNIEQLLELLPPERKERAMKYRFFSGKTSCVIAYLLFLYGYRVIYGNTDTPDFDVEDNGKPYLTSHPDIHFNLSHCTGAITCVFADSPVGVEIQECRKVTPSHIRKICTDAEADNIMSSNNPDEEFCKIWSVREAVSKCTGEGVFKNIRSPLSHECHTFTTHIEPDMYMTVATLEEQSFTTQQIGLNEIQNYFFLKNF